MSAGKKIERRAVVERNNPKIKEVNYLSPLSVGNGSMAFTADITGLQTFSEEYSEGMPLCTMSEWGWHHFPVPENLKGAEFKPKMFDCCGRQVGYDCMPDGQEELYDFLRANPHRFHLGRIGLEFDSEVKIDDVTDIDQRLNMYTGILNSNFCVGGVSASVTTCCMFDNDAISVKIKSDMLAKKRMAVAVNFPYASEKNVAADYRDLPQNETVCIERSARFIKLRRKLDDMVYFVGIYTDNEDVIVCEKNKVTLNTDRSEMAFTVLFSQTETMPKNICFLQAQESSTDNWSRYWENGGMIDFGKCTDPRAHMLEERMVKSMYLTRIQCCGTMPPQEAGLTCNSNWHGKAHLEMHYWHAAHFAIWGRCELLEKSMEYYLKYMFKGRELAQKQGYKGVRWPKMVDYKMDACPSIIAPLLIWQQPHPILYAELIYRCKHDNETLEKYYDMVEQTAVFMMDFLHYDTANDRYVLVPPFIPVQEYHAPEDSFNATFELEYWHYGLNVYRQWRERMGKGPLAELDERINKLAVSPVADGVYLAHEHCPDTFEKFNLDHPSMLGTLGVLPGERIDLQIMKNTLDRVKEVWQWDTTWGWDYALMAMCATRLGDTETAVDILLKDTKKNRYQINGHTYQYPELPAYLPSNGSLLIALGLMCAGWDGCNKELPGFPKNDGWEILFEDIQRYI